MRSLQALTTWALYIWCCSLLRSGTTAAMTERVSRGSFSYNLVKILPGNVPHFDDRDLLASKTSPIPTAIPTLAPSSLSTISNPIATNASHSASPFRAVLRWALLVPILSLTIMVWAVRNHFGWSSRLGLWCCLEGVDKLSTDPEIPDEIIVNDDGQDCSVASALGSRRRVPVDMELPVWSSPSPTLTQYLHTHHYPHLGNDAGMCEAPSDEEEPGSFASICEGQERSRSRSSVAKSSSSASSCSIESNLALSFEYMRMKGHA
jgi:hypothetical protein